ncbi:hydrogenase [Variovorax ureilyticus]|uniref:Hydrogenase n=1 Tax=Variovorax ureilyticus TaxID=1836198 RepID=A0ABU8VRJ6_9BURK
MNTEHSGSEAIVSLPVQPPRPATEASALISRLVDSFGATWLDGSTIDTWAAEGGDRVVLFAGDAVRFPEGQDVAAVLPELQRSFPGRFAIGVVPRDLEEAVALRFGSQRWPTLLFLRDGAYVTTVSGMHDWDVFQQLVANALASPVSRAPTIGIPVVSASASATSCH